MAEKTLEGKSVWVRNSGVFELTECEIARFNCNTNQRNACWGRMSLFVWIRSHYIFSGDRSLFIESIIKRGWSRLSSLGNIYPWSLKHAVPVLLEPRYQGLACEPDVGWVCWFSSCSERFLISPEGAPGFPFPQNLTLVPFRSGIRRDHKFVSRKSFKFYPC